MTHDSSSIWLVHDLLVLAERQFSNKPCLAYRGYSLSYSEVLSTVQKLAALLVTNGLRAGERVAVYFEKSIEEAVALLAVSMAGGIFVDINPLQRAKQILHILKDSGARFLMTSSPRLREISGGVWQAPELTTVIATGERGSDLAPPSIRLLNWKDADALSTARINFPRRIDAEPAAIIYTSGSTGMPKGVVFSHRNIVEGAKSVSSYLHNTHEDRILSVLPFSFDYGMNQMTTTLLVGATLVLLNYLTPQDIVKALQKEHITGLAGIPTIWSQLLQHNWSNTQFSSLRYITNSGGRLPEHLVREYRRRLPETKIFLMYGLTEAFRSTYLDPEQVDIRPTSIGKAIPNSEIFVVNAKNQLCAPGEIGELVHRGALVAMGYWNDPEKTRERFRPHPLQDAHLQIPELVVYSGDYVKQDDEGYIYYIGRKDEMIKTSGFRVSPTEVEENFYSTGLVQDAVAFGVPDVQKGEHIKVLLVLRSEVQISSQELVRLVAKESPSYMIPQEIELRTSLPKNPNGKIDRAAIKRAEQNALL